jgi:hypothetical protein
MQQAVTRRNTMSEQDRPQYSWGEMNKKFFTKRRKRNFLFGVLMTRRISYSDWTIVVTDKNSNGMAQTFRVPAVYIDLNWR